MIFVFFMAESIHIHNFNPKCYTHFLRRPLCRVCVSSSESPRLRMTSTPLCMPKGRDESRPVYMMANNAAG